MSEIADAPPWDSCDVTQFSHHLQRIKNNAYVNTNGLNCDG